MLYILHGDDIVKSKLRLSELTSGFGSVIVLNAEKATETDLVRTFSSNDLFVESKCIVIEKFLKLPKLETEKLKLLLAALDSSTTVILWHNTELSKAALGKFEKATVELFLFPKLFFTFLDNLAPQTIKSELDTLSKMQNVEAEQIFYAMVKRIRQLMMVKSNSKSEELVKMSPWQKGKLESQCIKWSMEQLERIYKNLYKIEIDIKSGGLMLPLKKHLDMLLINALN